MEKETTKQKILIEAVKLFSKEGYKAVSVEQIAEAVGIKAPSLYKHYKSKRDIFNHILQQMERQDTKNAAADSMPTETKETAPEAYTHIDIADLLAFCKRQFCYWTEDVFASSFRKMLTVEQYRDAEMNRLYHQYLGSGPLEYIADLLGSKEKALKLYAPMHLLYSVYDCSDDKKKVFTLLDSCLKQWQEENQGEKR